MGPRGPPKRNPAYSSRVFCLDKTGTLTQGIFTVSRWENLKETKLPIQQIVYSLEKKSNHPMALSLMAYLQQLPIQLTSYSVENFTEMPGQGIAGRIENINYHLKK